MVRGSSALSTTLPDLLCVPPHQVSEFWPYAEPLLKAATERCGNWTIEEIRQQIDKGALLWIA